MHRRPTWTEGGPVSNRYYFTKASINATFSLLHYYGFMKMNHIFTINVYYRIHLAPTLSLPAAEKGTCRSICGEEWDGGQSNLLTLIQGNDPLVLASL